MLWSAKRAFLWYVVNVIPKKLHAKKREKVTEAFLRLFLVLREIPQYCYSKNVLHTPVILWPRIMIVSGHMIIHCIMAGGRGCLINHGPMYGSMLNTHFTAIIDILNILYMII